MDTILILAGLAALIAIVALIASARRRSSGEVAAEAASAPAESAEAFEPAVEPGIDPSVVAAIAAAIMMFDGGNKALVVRSIRRASGWTRAARAEQVYRF